jgi:hypothetical protein
MDLMPTMVVKPEHQETKAPFLARQMSKRDDTSIGTTTRAARCSSLFEGLSLSYAHTRGTQEFLGGSDRRSIKPYIH